MQVKVSPSKVLKNYFGEISLLAYCLMSNHFHLLVRQNSERGIDNFMRSISTKFVRYFNTRHKRIGPLFQGPYKAVKVDSEYQLVYLSKYIHRNPLDLSSYKDSPSRLNEYKYSSYGNYSHNFNQTWVIAKDILDLFSLKDKNISYLSFVENGDPDDITLIAPLTIDLE